MDNNDRRRSVSVSSLSGYPMEVNTKVNIENQHGPTNVGATVQSVRFSSILFLNHFMNLVQLNLNFPRFLNGLTPETFFVNKIEK